ncbi:condensation domain-containing protein [Streptomyces sp. NPDC005551]|uniref:condensation domain-containing protein n=1 Tax=unclassified Streptomyces TaxID=2593676 RepID=UPI0033C072D6
MHPSERHGPAVAEGDSPSAHPVSFAQEQLYFLDELASGDTVYNILMVWRLTGPLRVDLLEQSLDLVVARHEALRTTVHRVDDTLHQVVAPHAFAPLPVTDLSELPAAEREMRLRAETDALRTEPYDLGTGPLHRFSLVRLGPQEHVFFQGFHHIVTDGWSTGLINAEISTAYRSLCSGMSPVFEERDLDYTDFAVEQRERLHGAVLEEDLDFWRAKLDRVPVLDLPADRPRPAGGGHHGETLNRDLPKDVRDLVVQLGNDHGASPFMVLAAALNVVLSRYTGQNDIPLGVPMLGRPEPELETVVGMFVNMAVLRCDLSDDPPFSELVDRVADGTLELYEHQEAPFNQVVDAVRPNREPGRNPLFQVSLQMLGGATSGENLSLQGVSAELIPQAAEGARFDVAITLVDDGMTLRASVEYSTDLFDPWRIEALLAHLETVLRAAAADPDRPVSRIALVDEDESRLLLAAGRGPEAEWDGEPVPLAVSRVARLRPTATAVVSGTQELTYADLDRRADALAARLRTAGLLPGGVAVVVGDRWADACVAALGVWRAGGVATHLGVEEAAGQLAFVAADTAAAVVVTDADTRARLPEPSGWAVVALDTEDGPRPAGAPLSAHEQDLDPGAPACVVYVPDAAGGIRGVVLSHRTLAFTGEGHRRALELAEDDRLFVLPVSSGSLWGDVWAALTCGATIVAATPEEGADAERVAALLRERRVTHAHLPPALRALLDPAALPALRHIRGADREPSGRAAGEWAREGRRFGTLWGPPSAPAACAGSAQGGTAPHVNRSLYVVDDALNPVPRGVTGRLLVGGAAGSLADGYLNQPEAAANRFVPDPFHPGRTAFLSDETARWSHDLRLELLGAADTRIERRGVPTSPARIETLLSSHPGIAAAVVLEDTDEDGASRVTACVRPVGDRAPAPPELRSHLVGLVPDALIPTHWMVVPALPLRDDWEVDREAVIELVAAGGAGDADRAEPRTPTEEAVTGIFCEVLAKPELGAEDSFFAAGGNSLQAMRVVSRINKRFGIKLSVRAMYGNVTVRALAALVDEKTDEVRS